MTDTPISGATTSTYTLVSADVGAQIKCIVTATNTSGVVSADSNMTVPIIVAPPADAATTAWIAAVVTAGGTVSGSRKALIDNLIVGLKADGVWVKLDRLWLFAAENTQSALCDLNALDTATVVNSPTFTLNRGYNGNGTSSYINTTFNPSVDGVRYSTLTACGGLWDISTSPMGPAATMGATDAGTYSIQNTMRYTDGNSYWRINASGGASMIYPGPGFYMINRSGVASDELYFNGALGGSSAAGTFGVIGGNVYVGAHNTTGTAGAFSSDQIAACVFGGSMNATEQLALYNRLRTYMTGVGVP